MDFIAASFVRKGNDVREVRRALGDEGKYIRVIAKVENEEGLKNFDEILEEADGIMVARGDLGMEIAVEKIFWVQKMMIRKCNIAGKPVVTATQMLDSMITSPRPTRAEATDVANAVLDGTDCVMLSGETAGGKFPIEAARTMRSICIEAESCEDGEKFGKRMASLSPQPMSVLESAAFSSVKMAQKTGARLIVVLAASGGTARLIAKYHPAVPCLVAVVPVGEARSGLGQVSVALPDSIYRSLLISRGLTPYIIEDAGADGPRKANGGGLCRSADAVEPGEHNTTDEIIRRVLGYAKSQGMIEEAESAVIVHGRTLNSTRFPTLQVFPCP